MTFGVHHHWYAKGNNNDRSKRKKIQLRILPPKNRGRHRKAKKIDSLPLKMLSNSEFSFMYYKSLL